MTVQPRGNCDGPQVIEDDRGRDLMRPGVARPCLAEQFGEVVDRKFTAR